jgi:Skp family chaperone for outer membrane proteins
MKRFSLMLVAASVMLTASASAQNVTSGAKPQTPPTSARPAVIPTGKLVVVNTLAFTEKIDEFKRQVSKLEEKFKARTTELQTIGTKLEELKKKVEDQNNAPEVRRQAQEQGIALEKEYKRKSEDLQADIEKEQAVILNPVREKVFRFMESYAASRGIVMIFDLAVLAQGNNLAMLPYLDPAADITEDFVKEYNKANPVAPAAATPAKPGQ